MNIKTLNGPSYEIENNYQLKGYKIIAGTDEAGRGPIAGPVVAAAVILDKKNIPDGINDSKKLSEKNRKKLFYEIKKYADVGVGVGDVEKIDNINILQSSLWAMKQAVMHLKEKPDFVLVDGNKDINPQYNSVPIIKGDGVSLSIAASSIIAKVIRDELMVKFSYIFKEYMFEVNKGYPTPKHLLILKKIGPSSIHRLTFKPVIISKANLKN
jgi:ribonuclease HII